MASSQKVKNSSQAALYIVIVLAIIFAVNFLFSNMFFRIDLTENKRYSISKATKSILKDVNDIINIQVYFSENLPANLKPMGRDVRDFLSEYVSLSDGNLRITWQDPAKSDELRQKVQNLGIPEIQMQSYEKDKAEVVRGYLGIAVLYEDRKEVLPVVQPSQMANFEYNLTQAIMKVFRSEQPKIGVVKTDTSAFIPARMRQQMRITEPDPTEAKYKPIYDNLAQNYTVETVDLSNVNTPISGEYRTIIVPGGEQWPEEKLYLLDQYLMHGGNMIVLVENVKVDFQFGARGSLANPAITKLLEHYGVSVGDQIVADAACGNVQIPQRFGQFQMSVQRPYPFFVRLGEGGLNPSNPAVSSIADIILPWASPLQINTEKVSFDGEWGNAEAAKDNDLERFAVVLAKSSDRSWQVTQPFDLNPQQQWDIEGQEYERSNLMVHLQGSFSSYFAGKAAPGKKADPQSEDAGNLSQISLNADDEKLESVDQAHLVVVSDADFLSDQNATPSNVTFLMNIVDQLSLDNNLIDVRSRQLVDRSITVDQLGEDSIKPAVYRWINILLMPVLLCIIGLVIYFSRREVSAAQTVTSEKKEK